MQIILARHGKPELQQWEWISPRQLPGAIKAYDEACVLLHGIPAETLERAAAAGALVSSTLPRCAQSAQALRKEETILCEDIFREVDLPHTLWPFPKLPLAVWGVIFRIAWFLGYSSRAESLAQARARARQAALRLVELAEKYESVMLVGHGIKTMLISKELLAMGWSGANKPALRYWEFRVYEKELPPLIKETDKHHVHADNISMHV